MIGLETGAGAPRSDILLAHESFHTLLREGVIDDTEFAAALHSIDTDAVDRHFGITSAFDAAVVSEEFAAHAFEALWSDH